MRSDKRGISDVIVTVLIILISIAAIFIVWQVLKPTIKESTEGINLEQSKVDITIMDKNIIPNLDNSFSIRLFRNAGAGNLAMIKVRVENETSSDVYNLSSEGFTELAEKLFVVPNTIANITKITVIPVILASSGESEAGISDFVTFKAGSVQTQTPQGAGCPTAECSSGQTETNCLDASNLQTRTCTQNLSGCYVWGSWSTSACTAPTTECSSGSCITPTSGMVTFSGCAILNQAGTTYGLTADYSAGNQPGACINITAANIVLDCQNHGVSSTNATAIAIYSNQAGTTIRNCNLLNKNYYGIKLEGANNAVLTNNVIKNQLNSLYIMNSFNVLIDGILAYNNSNSPGISLSNCNNSIIRNADLNNSFMNIQLSSTSNSIIENSLMVGTISPPSIYVMTSVNNTYRNLTLRNNAIGIYLQTGANNLIYNNKISSKSQYGYGIYIISSSNNKIYNNFLNNTNNLQIFSSNVTLNTTKTSGINIIGGSYIGGNLWLSPNVSRPAFSQNSTACKDLSPVDGICDSSYVYNVNATDYLPLKGY